MFRRAGSDIVLHLNGTILARPTPNFNPRRIPPMAFELTSSAFKPNDSIPKEYTCDGSDVSVPLRWKNGPAGATNFALIVDDPDAPRGTWVHWVLYDLPATVAELSAGVGHDDSLSNGAKQGKNDFGKIGYGGPCPP